MLISRVVQSVVQWCEIQCQSEATAARQLLVMLAGSVKSHGESNLDTSQSNRFNLLGSKCEPLIRTLPLGPTSSFEASLEPLCEARELSI